MNQGQGQGNGFCGKCNAPMAVSHKTGGLYCSAKCWLGGQQQQGYQQQAPQQAPQGYGPQYQAPKPQGPDWDKINQEKTKDIHWQVCFKAACAGWGPMAETLQPGDLETIHQNAKSLFTRLHVLPPWAQTGGNYPPPAQEPPMGADIPPNDGSQY